jgi:DNA-binding response OmpR family regulator
MNDEQVLIIDDDPQSAAILRATFAEAGVEADAADDAFTAMEKLRGRRYCAVILDPMIRQRLNGYAVLNYLEMEQPEMLDRLFLLTGMSEQTIRRTAPLILPRLFRKPDGHSKLAAAVVAACARDSYQPARGRRRSVLLVEDDRATANATVGLLDGLDYSAEWARNGREAIEALGKREFDAVILDLVMPHVDGFAVLDHLRSEGMPLRKVIVVTGMPDKYLETLDGSALGGILRKPFEIHRLKGLLTGCTDDHYATR